MTEKPFSVYTLSDPRTGSVRYVGISCEVEQRYQAHLHCQQNASKIAWVQELKACQLLPVLSIIETDLTFEEAKARELTWIRHYLEKGASLVNISGVTKPWVGGVCVGKKKKDVQVLPKKISRPLLTLAEAATRMNLMPSVLKGMLERSEMPGYRIGGWRIDQDELEEFLSPSQEN